MYLVHKYNIDQVQTLIAENKLSNVLCNFYTSVATGSTNDTNQDDSTYINFGEISEYDESSHNDKDVEDIDEI